MAALDLFSLFSRNFGIPLDKSRLCCIFIAKEEGMKHDEIQEITPTSKAKCVNCKQVKPVFKCFVGKKYYKWYHIQTVKRTNWCRECWEEAEGRNEAYLREQKNLFSGKETP